MIIKLFEDFTMNELYKKISFDEWKEKAYDDYPVYQNLSKIEKAWITKNLPIPIEIKWDVSWTRGEIKTNIKTVPNTPDELKTIIKFVDAKKRIYNLFISKTNDDWFIVELGIAKMGAYQHEYYICDQFDGLKEFFKDVMDIQ